MEGNSIFFQKLFHKVLRKETDILSAKFKSGGCINNAMKIHTSEGVYFVKWQKHIPVDMFEKEAKGLDLLKAPGVIKVPETYGYGEIDNIFFLVMEHVESAPPAKDYWEDYAEKLAGLHKQTSESYGLDHDNYIGKLYQSNKKDPDWIQFFIEQRLEPQLTLAMENRMVDTSFVNRYRSFYKKLPELLPVDQPALLHGDMWNGNVMCGDDGKVCLIDPAVYFGHREIELAFSKMFGGFSTAFYKTYQEIFPLEPGFDQRVDIYNIYPHMVHVNLFGGSYLGGVNHVLQKYL